jgi:hypothetical protein
MMQTWDCKEKGVQEEEEERIAATADHQLITAATVSNVKRTRSHLLNIRVGYQPRVVHNLAMPPMATH